MKTLQIKPTILIIALAIVSLCALHGQGTVTFDHPWATGGIGYATVYYDQSGISFRVGDPTQPHNNMARVGVTAPTGYPQNGTPYMAFVNTLGTPQNVVFAWTNGAAIWPQLFTDGAPFGLVSVDLADPVAPSLSPIGITFNGFLADGSMVSQTFTTPGSGSGFQTYLFGPDFTAGLTRVEIPSSAWAMDNIVFVPEPSSLALAGLGGLTLLAWHRKRRAN